MSLSPLLACLTLSHERPARFRRKKFLPGAIGMDAGPPAPFSGHDMPIPITPNSPGIPARPAGPPGLARHRQGPAPPLPRPAARDRSIPATSSWPIPAPPAAKTSATRAPMMGRPTCRSSSPRRSWARSCCWCSRRGSPRPLCSPAFSVGVIAMALYLLPKVQGADRRGAMGQTDARVLTDKTAIRDAATIIVLREDGGARRVLMGQRGKSAAFMPSKFVFPGGAVDAVDATIPLASPSDPADCARRLAAEAETPPEAVIAAATRELWEETGLLLGAPDPRAAIDAPPGWRGYLARPATCPRWRRRCVHLPRHHAARPPPPLRRAVPCWPGPRTCANDPDDFSRAEDELSHLQWVPWRTRAASTCRSSPRSCWPN
jgi:8-oxo-dGTP pyrophosphatase MutT (NUDIX family)